MAWLRLDNVAMSWIFGTISLDLQDLVRTHGGTARQAWVALEGQFLATPSTATSSSTPPSAPSCKGTSPLASTAGG